MSRIRRWFVGLLVLCLMLPMGLLEAQAEQYTYTVTFYPGNHGSFQGLSQVSVDNSKSGSSYQVSGGGSAITVSGLCKEDVVSFDAAMEGALALSNDSKYYVKGIRQSGRDNSTVDTSAFRVNRDQDYVVAYGIRGNLTSYVVHYQDASGRTLAPSKTSYGNVGDRPVIAFVYIEGYQPQAYNLTKTLSENTAENVFTFVYTKVRGTTGSGGSGTTGEATGGTGQTPEGTTEATPDGTANVGTGVTGGTGAAGGVGGATEGTALDGQTPGEGGLLEGAEQTAPAEDNAQALEEPREIVDLDDEETPLGNFEQEGNSGVRLPFGMPIAVWIAFLLAIVVVTGVLVRQRMVQAKRRKKEDSQE